MEEWTVEVEHCKSPKEKPKTEELEFGRIFTDHMLVIDYTEPVGWHDARIIPYQPLTIDPSAMVFHYGQS
ncbi:branched chain amino acid aminotransferase, partial [Virgibacillus halodenitrificans]|nr:branched chain amino acid aminotransferase [Virgibacillus halodenitrificans]